MKKFLALILTVVMAVACVATLSACSEDGGKGGNKDKALVALICLHDENSTYDKNFIDAFKAACVAKGLSEKQYVIATNIPEGQECYTKAADFADMGVKAVFANSFGHEDYIIQAAEEFPEVQFCHATGTKAHTENLENFSNAFASIYEGRYLAGIAAGMKLAEMYPETTEFQIGYVGAFPYAEVISGYTSFYLGVKAALLEQIPEANLEMEVRYTNSWYDEQAEKETANLLIDNGAMLISQHADSWGAPTACEERNIPNVSYNGSTESRCPNTFIVSSRINWQPYFEYMIDCALNDEDISEEYTGTLQNGSVELTSLGGAAATGTQAKLDAVKAQFLNGTLKVFNCANFTVGGQHLTSYLADVNTDANFTPDTEAIVTENGVTYFAESSKRSAPYFDIIIDGITSIVS